jgi:putative heme utilization carrier protein HutX
MTTQAAPTADHIRDYCAKHPGKLTLHVARELGVAEAEVVRHLPDDRSIELDTGRFTEIVEQFEPVGDVHVIVTNGAATLESVGTFGGFSASGGYFNVRTESLDMHIRADRIGAAFAVRKPSHMDGAQTLSVQFFDADGASAFKVFFVFGGSTPPPDRVKAWESLVNNFRK